MWLMIKVGIFLGIKNNLKIWDKYLHSYANKVQTFLEIFKAWRFGLRFFGG